METPELEYVVEITLHDLDRDNYRRQVTNPEFSCAPYTEEGKERSIRTLNERIQKSTGPDYYFTGAVFLKSSHPIYENHGLMPNKS